MVNEEKVCVKKRPAEMLYRIHLTRTPPTMAGVEKRPPMSFESGIEFVARLKEPTADSN